MDIIRFRGAKDRAVARLIHLIPLLLERPRERADLLVALADSLAEAGWSAALPATEKGEDPLPMLTNDLALIRALELVTFKSERPYRTEPGPRLPVWSSPEEAQALLLGRMALDQLGVPHAHTLDRMSARVPQVIRDAAANQLMTLSPSQPAPEPAVWEMLQTGLRLGRKMRITYRKPDGAAPEDLIVDRARLVWMTHAFYLVAYRPSYEAVNPHLPPWGHVREYRLDRIMVVEVLDSPVVLPALPELTCVFTLSAELRERVFPLRDPAGRLTLDTEVLEDGTMRVTMKEVSLLRARQRLSLYGEHVLSIEEPIELRASFARALSTLAARFLVSIPTP